MTTVAETRTRKPNRRKNAIPRVSLPFGPCTRPDHTACHEGAAARLVAKGLDPARIEAHARAFGGEHGRELLATSLHMRRFAGSR